MFSYILTFSYILWSYLNITFLPSLSCTHKAISIDTLPTPVQVQVHSIEHECDIYIPDDEVPGDTAICKEGADNCVKVTVSRYKTYCNVTRRFNTGEAMRLEAGRQIVRKKTACGERTMFYRYNC